MCSTYENDDFKVTVTGQKAHSIAFGWEYKGGQEYRVFKVEKRYGNNSWDLVYWGKKTQLIVRGLEMDLCFTFQVTALQLNPDDGNYFDVGKSKIFSVVSLHDISLATFHRTIEKRVMHALKTALSVKPEFINMPGKGGYTALAIAVRADNDDAVRVLLSHGAHVNLGLAKMKRSPYMMAIGRMNIRIARALLEKRPDVNLQDVNQLSACHFAVDTNHFETIRFCVEHGSNLELIDSCKFNIILRAIVMESSLEIIEYLLEKGVDLSVRDRNHMTCLDHARLQQRTEVISLLQGQTMIKLSREPTP